MAHIIGTELTVCSTHPEYAGCIGTVIRDFGDMVEMDMGGYGPHPDTDLQVFASEDLHEEDIPAEVDPVAFAAYVAEFGDPR